VELVGELEPRSAGSLSERIPALDHEAVDHAVEDDPIVVLTRLLLVVTRIGVLLRAFCQADEVLDRLRRLVLEQTDEELPFGGVESRVHAWCHWC
jgi:hypothetical protein